jgi:hypothetical protein
MAVDSTGLIPYWITFQNQHFHQLGVTAYSLQDAFKLLAAQGYIFDPDRDISSLQPHVRVADLDQRHVVGNMGPIIVRGVWYPCLNIGWRRIEPFW